MPAPAGTIPTTLSATSLTTVAATNTAVADDDDEHLELHQLVSAGGRGDSNRTRSSPARRTSASYEPLQWRRLIRRCSQCSSLGILLATLSSLFFSLCSVIVKGLVDVHPVELASYRFVGVLLPALPIVIHRREPSLFPPGRRIILLLRCLVGTTGLMLSFYSFRHMPLADASVIIFSTPVFVAIFARLFLREPCGPFNVATVALTLLGCVLITRPPLLFGHDTDDAIMNATDVDTDDNVLANEATAEAEAARRSAALWGPVAALASTLFGANAYVLLRALKGLHYSVIMTNFGALGLAYTALVSWWLQSSTSSSAADVTNTPVVACTWQPPCAGDRWLVVALALFSFAGQILLTLALQLEQAGPVAIARSADIVFAFVWQVAFFGELPNRWSVAGAVLVVSSVVLTGGRKWVLGQPRESRWRQRLRWVMWDK